MIASIIFNASKVKQKLRLAELSAKSKTPIQSDKKAKTIFAVLRTFKKRKTDVTKFRKTENAPFNIPMRTLWLACVVVWKAAGCDRKWMIT